MALDQPTLVPGRECGECTLCCEVLHVDSPDFQKPQGVRCAHCVPGGGCAIHATRPNICREWFCQWRRYAWLDDSWRPDRSQLLLRATDDGVPAGYSSAIGVVIDVLGPCEILQGLHVLETIATLIDAGIATFLSVPPVLGRTSGRVLLNPWLATAVQRRNGDAMSLRLVDAFLLSALTSSANVAA